MSNTTRDSTIGDGGMRIETSEKLISFFDDIEKVYKKYGLSIEDSHSGFSIREYNEKLDMLMKKCGCEKYSGGRGSSIAYLHIETKRILQFDEPHLGKELYIY